MADPRDEPAPAEPGGAPWRLSLQAWIAIAIAAVLCAVVLTVWIRTTPPLAAPTPTATVAPTRTAAPAPTPTPTPTVFGYPANTTAYDVQTLPQVNVFTVLPALLVDDAPFGAFAGETVRATGIGAPVFADPAGAPVGYVPREFPYEGTTLPVVERQDNWVKVLLTGRQAVPSQGNPAQAAGWLRVQDVETAASDARVEVSISAHTIEIVRGADRQLVSTDFAWGTSETPTPLGRTFIMYTAVVPEFAYTRGHPIVYFGVQSPTLDGFGGADVAITAFHYHDDHSGPISNGCLRLDAAAIDTLAQLPLGTPIIVNP
ncbi:L,D-transpeptidase [Microbacterium sp. BWT-B31]|uniref:L,D-transpeptidase n=1 Tax=Microbacterium sp. BWT-B31 TaxID=3232072 RepID=UPI003528BAB1